MSNRDIRQRLPPVGLTALLLEIDADNGFSGTFFPVSNASANIDDLQVGISSLLLAEGCDSGLEPLISSPIAALRWHRLNETKAIYLLAETSMALANIAGGGCMGFISVLTFLSREDSLSVPNRR